MAPNPSITVLVHECVRGDKAFLGRLLFLVFERQSHALQPTALVHELYARLVGQRPPDFRDRIHFLSVSNVMPQILIDLARSTNAQKRGERKEKVSIGEYPHRRLEIVFEIDDALNQLSGLDPRTAKLIEMRFFGGPTAEESACVPGLPVNAVSSRAARCPCMVLATRVRPKARRACEVRITAG